jgi:hypothetical protein
MHTFRKEPMSAPNTNATMRAVVSVTSEVVKKDAGSDRNVQ